MFSYCLYEAISRETVLFDLESHASILNPQEMSEEQVTSNIIPLFI